MQINHSDLKKFEGRKIRWGIAGAGRIAHSFALGLTKVPDAELAAVASKSGCEAAERFIAASPNPRAKAFGSYEELFKCDAVDIVYVANINTEHYATVLTGLDLGKPILCEKPFAMSAADAREMCGRAHEKGLFLMEAMWSRFNPVNQRLREWVREGRIGRLHRSSANFGYFGGEDRSSRHLNAQLGGGALPDVGIYPLSFFRYILGESPIQIVSDCVKDEVTGVDRQFSAILRYKDGLIANAGASVINQLDNSAWLYGAEGAIEVPCFFNPKKATVYRYGKTQEDGLIPVESFEPQLRGNGYQYEAMECARCLRAGLPESPDMPHAETVELLEQIELMYRQWS